MRRAEGGSMPFLFKCVAIFPTPHPDIYNANIIPIIVLLFLHIKNDKGKIKWFIIISISILVFTVSLNYIPALSFVFERSEQLQDSGNVLNGREEIYKQLLNNIDEHYILGSGIRSTLIITNGNDGHNIYLQVLSELGIIGFLMVLIILLCNVITSIKNYKEKNKYVNVAIYFQIFFIISGISGNVLYYIPTMYIYMLVNSSGFLKETHKEEL